MLMGVIAGTLTVMSSSSWPIAWLGLELNLMCFVPVVMKEENLKKTCMMYFVVQSVGSLSIIAAGLLMDFNSWAQLFLVLGILLKMGAMPLHFWVPMIVPRLSVFGVYFMQSWQKLAPVSLLLFVIVSKEIVSLVNIWMGSFTMSSMSTPVMVVIFSGMVQMGWIFSIFSSLLWWFIIMYFVVLAPLVKFMNKNSSNFSLSLVNGGGLPPFTGFMMKLNAVKMVSAKMSALMIMGSGVALLSYTRMLLNLGYLKDKVSPLVILSMAAGMV